MLLNFPKSRPTLIQLDIAFRVEDQCWKDGINVEHGKKT